MPKVKGTHGKLVSYEVLGINETLRMLKTTATELTKASELGIVRAATFVMEEVQESIAGKRAEPKSVDTGLFLTSIDIEKGKGTAKVFPKKKTYPGTSTTTQDVGNILEYGTSKRPPRSHFRNTVARTKKKVKEIVEIEVKKKIK